MEISLQTMLWITGGLFIFAIIVGLLRRKQMQRAADLFVDTENSAALLADDSQEDHLSQYSEQVLSPTQSQTPIVPDAIAGNEAKQVNPTVLVLFLRADEGQEFGGYDLQQAFANANLVYGDMKIFHYHEMDMGKGNVLFSVASAVEPGIIDIDHIGTFSTPGLCLILDCQQTPYPLQSFKLMVRAGKQLQEELGGQLLDQERQPWSKDKEFLLREQLQQLVVPQAEQALH